MSQTQKNDPWIQWLTQYYRYIYQILEVNRTHPLDTPEEATQLHQHFREGVHPYYVAVRKILQRPEFVEGQILRSFVIPYEDKLTLIKV